MYPVFKTFSDGTPILKYTSEATEYMKKRRAIPTVIPAKPQNKVHAEACKRVVALGRSSNDRKAVLGQYVCQFGAVRGQTFKWVAENSLGWAAALAVLVSKEVKSSASPSCNKFALKEYLELFSVGRKAIDLKNQKRNGSGNLVLQGSNSAKKAPATKKKLQQKKPPTPSANAPSTSGLRSSTPSARKAKSSTCTRASTVGEVASSSSMLEEVNEPQLEMLLYEAAADFESQAALQPSSSLPLPDG